MVKMAGHCMNLFYYFIQYYKLSFVIMLAGLLAGIAGLMGLRREARPPVDFARVAITTAHPGASSEEIEEQITNKLEQKLKNISGIRHSYSISSPGLSQITLYLDLDNIDTEHTVTEIHRAVQSVPDLPPNLLEKPLIQHEKAKEIPIMHMALVGTDSQRNRRAFALKLQLQHIPNVAQVKMTGFQKREYQILLNTHKIQRHSISLPEVVQSVQAFSQDISAGLIQDDKTKHSVQVFGKIKQAEELKHIIVRSNFSGQKIRIQDIARVQDAEEELYSAFLVKNQPATLLEITKKENTDSIKTIQQIKSFLKTYQQNLGPHLKIITLFDESEKTQERLKIVSNNALFGLILVLIVLLLCLPGWLGAMSAISLPFSILSTVALIASMGVTFNIITMCAFVICIGMLVDNSIVISEHYARLQEKGLSPQQSALKAVTDLFPPLCATTATTVLAFLPMLITKGVMGQFVRWIPIVVSIALLVSLIEAFFLLPCRLRFCRGDNSTKLSSLIVTLRQALRTLKSQKPNQVLRQHLILTQIETYFEAFILKALHKKYLSLFLIFCAVSLSFGIGIFKNRFILFPKANIERYLAIFEIDKTLSLPEMQKKVERLQEKTRSIIGEKYIRHSFSTIDSLRGKGSLTVEIHPKTAQKWNYKDILKKLRTIDASAFKKLRFSAFSLGPPVGRPVELILFSTNTEELAGLAEEVSQMLHSIEGLLNQEDSREYSGPEYAVYVDNKQVSRLQLNRAFVGQALKTALHGAIVAEVTDQGENFYIRVKYDNQGRSHIDLLKYIHIMANQGQIIPLNKLLKWELKAKGPEIKKHYAFMPSISFYADVDLNKITSLSANRQIQQKLPHIMKKYPSVSYKQVGEQESTQESLKSLLQAMVLVVGGIFAILLLMFNSFSISLLILSNVLLGFVGISWSFLFHSRPLSFFALIGAVGLAGVVINSAIILVSFIEKTKKENPNSELNKILARSAKSRLRPILITTITTVLGLFPTAYGIGGYDSVLIPITLSLTWGLISGTLLTLIWTPCGYLAIHEMSKKIQSLRLFL